MKILVITKVLPFPPHNGFELTNAHIFQELSENNVVDIIVVNNDCNKALIDRKHSCPETIGEIVCVNYYEKKWLTSTFKELFCIEPNFYHSHYFGDKVIAKLDFKSYDYIWISPIGLIGFVDYLQNVKVKSNAKIIIGLNDVKTTLYLDAFKQFLSGRQGWSREKIQKGLRVPWIWWYERRYLKRADLIHVQTELEAKRANGVLGRYAHKKEIIYAQNGKKTELYKADYNGSNSNKILYMTHLDGARKKESLWFLTKVWPKIYENNQQAELLLVGTPPSEKNVNDECFMQKGVKICGFVDDLVDLYDSVALAVVPTQHGTGLVNRVYDALCAAVPVVACPEPLSTIKGLVPDVHALSACTAKIYVEQILELLSNKEKRTRLSESGRMFSRSFPTWSESVAKIQASMLSGIE